MYTAPSLGRSTSRITLLHHCHKKYFFQYYTNALRDVDSQIRLDALLLKNLTSFKMRLGEKTHHIIADYLRLLAEHKNVPSEQIQTLKDSMAVTMQQQFQLSRNRDYSKYDKELKFGFKEHAYGEDIDDSLSTGIAKVLGNLDAFLQSDLHTTVQGYFTNGNKYYIEENESDFDQMQVVIDEEPALRDVILRAGPDFGIMGADSSYYIYDRKSGTEKEIPSDSITDQLKVYAYKLLHNTHKTLADIQIYCYEVYLPSLHMIGGPIQQADIDDIYAKICEQVDEQKDFLVDRNPVRNHPLPVQQFARTAFVQRCESCKFRRSCAKLKKIEGDHTPNPFLDDVSIDTGRLF